MKKVNVIVSPFYYVSQEVVDLYAKLSKEDADILFAVTDANLGIFPLNERVFNIGHTLLNKGLNIAVVPSLRGESDGEDLTYLVEETVTINLHTTLGIPQDEVGDVELEYYSTYSDEELLLDAHYIGDYDKIEGFTKDEDILVILGRMSELYKHRFGMDFMASIEMEKEEYEESYSIVPFFRHEFENIDKSGEVFDDVTNVYLMTYDHAVRTNFLIHSPADTIAVSELLVKSIAEGLGSSLTGHSFMEVFSDIGVVNKVIFVEIEDSVDLTELLSSDEIVQYDESSDLILVPEVKLFDLGLLGAWVSVAKSNPSTPITGDDADA